jgi:hypothetical protein
MIKLLVDSKTSTSLEDMESGSRFSTSFNETSQGPLYSLSTGLVVPQKSLWDSIKNIFGKILGLNLSLVMIPFDMGQVDGIFDLQLTDDTRRLNQRASQRSGALNAKIATITRELFGSDDTSKTQLDWI